MRSFSGAAALFIGLVLMNLPVVRCYAQSNLSFATQRFDQGVRHYEGKRFQYALEAFRASYDLYASPNTRLYVARTLRELGRLAQAVDEFAIVEREARDRQAQDPRYRQAAEAARAERALLEPKLGFVRLRFSEPLAPGVEISVGGRNVPPAAAALPIRVTGGVVRVLVRDRQSLQFEAEIHVPKRKTIEVHVPVAGLDNPSAEETRDTTTPTPAEPMLNRPQTNDDGGSLLGAVLIGAGVAAAIGSGVLFALTAIQHDEVKACDAMPSCLTSTRRDDLARVGETYQVFAYVTGGVALASIGSGLVFLALEDDEGDDAQALAEPRIRVGASSTGVSFELSARF